MQALISTYKACAYHLADTRVKVGLSMIPIGLELVMQFYLSTLESKRERNRLIGDREFVCIPAGIVAIRLVFAMTLKAFDRQNSESLIGRVIMHSVGAVSAFAFIFDGLVLATILVQVIKQNISFRGEGSPHPLVVSGVIARHVLSPQMVNLVTLIQRAYFR